MKTTRSGDRNQTGGDRYLPDRGLGLWRRGDRYLTDRWLGLTTPGPPPPVGHLLNGLAGYWKMDEASGTRADSTANGNNLSDNGGTLAAAGIINNGAHFVAASSQFLSHVSNATLVLAGTSFTIGCWINATSVAGPLPIINKDGAVTREYDMVLQGSQVIMYVFGGAIDDAGSVMLVPNTWYYVLGGYDLTQAKPFISINNGPVTYGSGGSTGAASGASDMQIGGRTAWGGFFDGVIDELGIWKRLLTTSEKTMLYNGGAGLPFGSFTP